MSIIPLISIIVPAFKVEKYIDKCVQSLLKQTYQNIEIILVDDGSPDRCGSICDEYASQDSRIKVIHKENGGLSEARNFGIDAARGEYMIFVDSDDYVSHNMCEILLKYAKKYNADIVSCNFDNVYENKPFIRNIQSVSDDQSVLSGREMIYRLFFRYSVDLNVVWNKLYNKKVFDGKRKIRFPVGILHEDDFVIYQLYYNANKTVVINASLYKYLRRSDSITGNYSEKNVIDIIKGAIEQYNFSNDKEQYLKYMIQVHSIDLYHRYIKCIGTYPNIVSILEEYRKIILANESSLIHNPYMNWKKYVKYFLLRFNLYHFFFYKVNKREQDQ